MNTDLTEILTEYTTERSQAIEAALVKSIEEYLGRVPTDHEISRHGLRKIYPDASEYHYWDDHLLFKVTGLQMVTKPDGKIYCQFQITPNTP